MSAETHTHHKPEPSAVRLGVVAAAACGTLLLLAIAIGGLYAIYQASIPVKTMPGPQNFPQPRVDTRQVEELHRIIGEQRQRLETWRWANDQHTLVQIPIERAMQLLAQKGTDAYAPLVPPQAALSSPKAAAQQAVTPHQTGSADVFKNAPAQENVQ